jgi:hypothetical protein
MWYLSISTTRINHTLLARDFIILRSDKQGQDFIAKRSDLASDNTDITCQVCTQQQS